VWIVRYALPAAIVVAGFIVLAVGPSGAAVEGGMGLIGAGLAVGFLNLLFRIGASGDREREAEERAREYFDRHGRWPDEP
jgi:hypothetical protein